MTGVSDATERARLTTEIREAIDTITSVLRADPHEPFAKDAHAALDVLAAELEAADQQCEAADQQFTLLQQEFEAEKERAEAAEKRNAEIRHAYLEAKRALRQVTEAGTRTEAGRIANVLLSSHGKGATPRPCLNCGSREHTTVCADCGRINPDEEAP